MIYAEKQNIKCSREQFYIFLSLIFSKNISHVQKSISLVYKIIEKKKKRYGWTYPGPADITSAQTKIRRARVCYQYKLAPQKKSQDATYLYNELKMNYYF